MVSSCARGVSGWVLGKFLLRRSANALEQAGQGGDGDIISGGFPELWRCGTEGHRLMVGLDDLSGLSQP